MGQFCSSEPQPGPSGAAAGPSSESVLIFPDPGMPCKFGSECRRKTCTFQHGETNLTALLKVINSAKRTCDVCVFTITCDEISDSIIALHKRGVKVRVISDNDQADSKGSDIANFRSNGIPVRLDKSETHMHHKFAIIDGETVINGSFNWTRQAVLGNRENVVVSKGSKVLCTRFAEEFNRLWEEFK